MPRYEIQAPARIRGVGHTRHNPVVYVVLRDGKRVDSFLTKTKALAYVKEREPKVPEPPAQASLGL